MLALPASGPSWTDGTDPWIEMKRSIASFSVGQYYGTVPTWPAVCCSLLFCTLLGAPGTFLDRRGLARTLRKLFLARSIHGKQGPLGDVGEQILGLLRFMREGVGVSCKPSLVETLNDGQMCASWVLRRQHFAQLENLCLVCFSICLNQEPPSLTGPY